MKSNRIGMCKARRRRRDPDPQTGLPGLVLELVTDSPKDLAVAVHMPWRGVIYDNPAGGASRAPISPLPGARVRAPLPRSQER